MPTYTVSGTPIDFPHPAYGTQLVLMGKVVSALDARAHALLEAPTGSGKTLALLCGALAWQGKARAEAEGRMGEGATVAPGPRPSDAAAAPKPGYEAGPLSPGAELAAADALDAAAGGRAALGASTSSSGRVPRVFYASRTHSQLAQVVRELKRTSYTPRTAILASREHTCINAKVLAAVAAGTASRDDACDRAVVAGSCAHYKGVHRLLGPTSLLPPVHDVEDLVAAGKRARACPYFATRARAVDADLVLAPYSYLLDPPVRSALDIDTTDAVIIIDEAHNVEDACREAASASVSARALVDAAAALARAAAASDAAGAAVYSPLATAVDGVAGWLTATANGGGLAPAGYEAFERAWQGAGATAALSDAGLGPAAVRVVGELLRQARTLEDGRKGGGGGGGENDAAAPSQTDAAAALKAGGLAWATLSRLLSSLDLMHASAGSVPPCFRLAVRKEVERGGASDRRGRRRAPADADAGPVWTTLLTITALSPAPAFAAAAGGARSVVLASGTLAPTASFASELATPFPIKLEAPHVVDMAAQVWAGTCAAAPDGTPLTATYRGAAAFAFQDGVAACLASALSVTPGGVLAFFPSYALLDRLVARWRATGAWSALCAIAPVVAEPRGGDRGAFDTALADYYAAIDGPRGKALFLAVCRGKASEGLDFADARARAVLVFGIPFPSATDTAVLAKKAYNDARAAAVASGAARGPGVVGAGSSSASTSITAPPLNGDAWYVQAAFRALNQAVGRCIRHRGDWGAIVLVDTRFRDACQTRHLSRWVRGALVDRPDFGAVASDLAAFFERLTTQPPPGVVAAAAPPPPQPPPPTTTATGDDDRVTASQPTLRALWAAPIRRKPEAADSVPVQAAPSPKRAKEEARPPLAPVQPPAPPPSTSLAAMAAAVKPAPPLPPVRPVDTQTVGRGVDAAVGAWKTESREAVPPPPPPPPPPALLTLSPPRASPPIPSSAPLSGATGCFVGGSACGGDDWWEDDDGAMAALDAAVLRRTSSVATPASGVGGGSAPALRRGAASLAAARAAAGARETPPSGASSGWK